MTRSATKIGFMLVIALASYGAGAGAAPPEIPLPAPPESIATTADTLGSALYPFTSEAARPARRAWLLRSGSEIVASRRAMVELASSSIGEALVPDGGIHVLREGWHGMPEYLNTRGGRASEIVYLLDGLPISDNQIGVTDLDDLPLAGLDEAVVARGGLSSVYGSGAVAGALDLVPLTAMPEVPESEVTAWWGSNAARDVSVRFNRRLTNRLGVLGTYENLDASGWIDNAWSKAEGYFGRMTYIWGGSTEVAATGYRRNREFQWPDSCPGVAGTSPGEAGNDRDLFRFSVTSGRERRAELHYYRLGSRTSFSSAETSYVHEGVLNAVEAGLTFEAPDSSVTRLTAGFKDRHLKSSSYGDRSSSDIYAQALRRWRLGVVDLEGSMRLVKNSDFDPQAGLGLSVRYRPLPGVSLFARLDRSFGFPSFGFMYARGPDRPADARVGPETSLGAEAGAALRRGSVSFKISAFRRHSRGEARLGANDSCTVFLASDVRTDATGGETLVRFNPVPGLDARVSYTLWSIRSDDRTAPYLPRYLVKASARLARRMSPHISIGLTLAAWYVSPIEVGSKSEPCAGNAACTSGTELDGYASSLVYAHIDMDRAVVFFRVHNAAGGVIKTQWGRPSLPGATYDFGVSVVLVD